MKHYIILIVFFLLFSCCQKQSSNNSQNKGINFLNYTNEYFSIKYPENWDYEEEINYDYDTIPEMSTGIRTIFYSKDPIAPFQTVCVQKSAMFHVFDTPEQWRDLSVEMKNFNDEYIGTIDSMMLDSLKFGPYPASMAGFIVNLGGDTIIHKQLVVMVNKDIYYLNNSYDFHDKGLLQQRGDSILATIKFKTS